MSEGQRGTRSPTYGRRTRGAVAGMARKHCTRCGRTLPNRARSEWCTECYPAAALDRDLSYKRARKERKRLERQIAILNQSRGSDPS